MVNIWHVAKTIHFYLFMFINVAAIIFVLYVYPNPSETQYHVACQLAS